MTTRSWGLLLLSAALFACSNSVDTSGDGRIRIAVYTSGSNPQTAEYLLTLDGERPLSVEPNGAIVYDAVTEGTHVIHLFALADNCVVSGSSSPRSVQVRRGVLAEVQFTVICGPPLTGGFRVVVSSTGSPVDEDGYQLSVAGTPLRTIDVNARVTYEGLTPGARLITLKDVADFCEVVGGNPRPYTVVAGKAVQVTLQVSCGPPPGTN